MSISKSFRNNKGTAMLMTVLILTSILVVSLASSSILSSGIKMNRSQTESTKAFFAAESGAEKALWEMRKNNFTLPAENQTGVFVYQLSNGSAYSVDFASTTNFITFTSSGDYLDVKRSIAVDIVTQTPEGGCTPNCDGKSCGANDGCGGTCPETCASAPGCSSTAILNASLIVGSCCTGSCYKCDNGYVWNGSACTTEITDAATIDGWCWDCAEYTYPDPQDPVHGDMKEYIDYRF